MTVAADATARMQPDVWLTAVMDQPVFRVDLGFQAEPEALTRAVRAHAGAQRAAMYVAKVATTRLPLVHALGDAGLRPIDVAVTFELDPRRLPARADAAEVVVRDGRPADAAEVLDIAGSCFVFSRFHLDPRIPVATAHRVKREWTASCVNGARGEALLVASRHGRVAGFLTVIASGAADTRVVGIDLMASAAWARRQGVGSALVRAFVDRYAATGAALRVGTQAANVPSVRMYEQLGFVLVDSQYVLHGHVVDGVMR